MSANPVSVNPAARRPAWMAGVLALCCPGLGHLYVGRLTRGLLVFLVSLILVPAAALVAGIASSTAALAGLVVACGLLLGLWIFAVVDACRLAKNASDAEAREYQRPVVYALFLVAGILSPMLSAAYVRRSVLEAFYLPTNSMSPALRSGDRILVNKTTLRLEHLARWDVVVFKFPENRRQNYIKRIVGLPGDEVIFNQSRISVNGISISEEGVPEDVPGTEGSRPNSTDKQTEGDSSDTPPQKLVVPPGTCFLLGDNVSKSLDSRKFGPVPLGDIIGVAEYVYLPGDSWRRFGVLR